MNMEKYEVCIDFGGRARNYTFVATSEEDAIKQALAEHPQGRDFIVIPRIKAIIEGRKLTLINLFDDIYFIHDVETEKGPVDYEYDMRTGICIKGYTNPQLNKNVEYEEVKIEVVNQ